MQEMIEYIERSTQAIASLNESVALILSIGGIIVDRLKKGNKLLILGNGGSAAQAQHFAAELIVKFKRHRKPWPAIALTADTATITACANDFSYSEIFTRQVHALAQTGDVVFCLTTSGNSENVYDTLVRACPVGSGIIPVVLTGRSGGICKQAAHYVFNVDSDETAVIQDAHQVIIHALSDYIERKMTE